VDLMSAVVADEQPFEVVQPGECALDDPADGAEPGAVLGLATCDYGGDAPLTDEPAVRVVVVATIGDDLLGASPWSADGAAHGRHLVDERDQLRDVVTVAAGDRVRERDPRGVNQEVVLRSGSASVHRARARFGAPFFAWIWLPSTTARDHSISPACCSRASSSSCSLSHTPAACHSSSRRRHVAPDPNPSSKGRCRHAIPVYSTNKIPCSVSRSPSRLRPGYRNRRVVFGSSGSISSHNPSGTSHGLAVAMTSPFSLTTDADGVQQRRARPFILIRVLSAPRRKYARPSRGCERLACRRPQSRQYS